MSAQVNKSDYPLDPRSGNVVVAIRSLNWTRLLCFLKPYWGRMLLASSALLISMGFSLVFPLVISRLLDAVAHAGNAAVLNHWALLLTGVFFGQAVFSFVQVYLLAVVGEHIVYDLRTRLYDQLQSLSLDFFAGRRIGELVSRLTNDVTQMRTMLTNNLTLSLSYIVSLVGALVIVLTINPRLTFFTIAVIPLVILVAAVYGNALQKGSAQVQDKLAASTVVAEEALQGIRIVNSFGRERFETRRFAESTQAVLRASIRQAIYGSSFAALMLFLSLVALGGIVWFGGHEVIAGRLSLAMITGFIMYGVMIAGNLAGLAGMYGQMRAGVGGIERVFQILDLRPSVMDLKHASVMPTVRGRITFDDVSFGYEQGALVLKDIDLEIHAGEILALVGPSGAGKSSAFNLIPRFYDPMSGSVRIDGLDLRTVTQSSLRAQMAIVPQESILFGDTIRENILYGRLEATEAEIISAAKAADAHEFILELPGKYETIVGERGAKLSGGQRQRIAVARAILKNPCILLLDEATSSLDGESEELVQGALNGLMQGRTTIIIAHRLSTIKAAHRIAVLDRGRLVELGSHDQLIGLNGSYAHMYRMQFRESDENSPIPRMEVSNQESIDERLFEGVASPFSGMDFLKLLPSSSILTK